MTGAGTSFTTQLRQGDLIRANGQVRQIATITNNDHADAARCVRSRTCPRARRYERLDGFDHESFVEIPLLQEKAGAGHHDLSRPQHIQHRAGGAGRARPSSTTAFYVVLQDRTSRPFTIAWPVDVEPALHGLIAPPVYAAGVYTDPGALPSWSSCATP